MPPRQKLHRHRNEQVNALREALAEFQQNMSDVLRESMVTVLDAVIRADQHPPIFSHGDDSFFDEVVEEGDNENHHQAAEDLYNELYGAPIFDVYDDTDPIFHLSDGANQICDDDDDANPIFDVYDDTNSIVNVCDGANLIYDECNDGSPVFDFMTDENSANYIFNKREIDVIGIYELPEGHNTNLFCRSDEDLSNEVLGTMCFNSYVDIGLDEIQASVVVIDKDHYPEPVVVFYDKKFDPPDCARVLPQDDITSEVLLPVEAFYSDKRPVDLCVGDSIIMMLLPREVVRKSDRSGISIRIFLTTFEAMIKETCDGRKACQHFGLLSTVYFDVRCTQSSKWASPWSSVLFYVGFPMHIDEVQLVKVQGMICLVSLAQCLVSRFSDHVIYILAYRELSPFVWPPSILMILVSVIHTLKNRPVLFFSTVSSQFGSLKERLEAEYDQWPASCFLEDFQYDKLLKSQKKEHFDYMEIFNLPNQLQEEFCFGFTLKTAIEIRHFTDLNVLYGLAVYHSASDVYNGELPVWSFSYSAYELHMNQVSLQEMLIISEIFNNINNGGHHDISWYDSALAHLFEKKEKLIAADNKEFSHDDYDCFIIRSVWVLEIALAQTYVQCHWRKHSLEPLWAFHLVFIPSFDNFFFILHTPRGHEARKIGNVDAKTSFSGYNDSEKKETISSVQSGCSTCLNSLVIEAKVHTEKQGKLLPSWLQFSDKNKGELVGSRRQWRQLRESLHQKKIKSETRQLCLLSNNFSLGVLYASKSTSSGSLSWSDSFSHEKFFTLGFSLDGNGFEKSWPLISWRFSLFIPNSVTDRRYLEELRITEKSGARLSTQGVPIRLIFKRVVNAEIDFFATILIGDALMDTSVSHQVQDFDYLYQCIFLDREECQFDVLRDVIFRIVVPYIGLSIGVNAVELTGVRRFLHFAFLERVLRPFGFFVISDLTKMFMWPPWSPMPCVFSLIPFTTASVMFPFLVSLQLECQHRDVSGRFYDMRRPFFTAILVWEEAAFDGSHVLVGVNFSMMGLSHDARNTMCASVTDLINLMLLMEWYFTALRFLMIDGYFLQLLCICNQDSRTNLFLPGGTDAAHLNTITSS